MRQIILIASLLMASGLYAEQLICELFEGRKNVVSYYVVMSNKDLEEGLGYGTQDQNPISHSLFYKRSKIGEEKDGTPFLYLYDIVYEDGDTNTFYFYPSKMTGTLGRYKNLKCRYDK